MKTNISEDLPARRFSPAAASSAGESGDSAGGENMEKRARQLVYDSKYQVKKSMGPDSKMDPAAVVRAVLERIDKSEYSQPIKARARKIVLGDSQKKEVKESASYNVARALYSVFVEQSSKLIDEEYIEKLKKELSEADQSPEERKYKVRVTDKETGNSYIRWANRSKINELRANPNIASVEMLDLYGSPEPNESERTKGSQTASVKAGKGLKNNDGNLANNYPPYNKVTRGDVIAGATGNDQMGGKRKVKEEFIGEKDNGDKEIKPMKGKNKCKVHDPSGKDSGVGGREGLMAHNELEGKVISETGYTQFLKAVKSLQEKAESEQQQKLFGLALSVKRGETPRSEVSAEVLKIVDTMSEKKIRDFAKTKHEGLPEKVKESKCDDSDNQEMNDKEEDPRSMKTKINLVKNKLRAMGLKMSYEPEGDVIDEKLRSREERMARTITPAQRKKQEMKRKKEEELAHQADLALAGMRRTAKPGAVTRTSSKPEAPEANRKKLKFGKKVDTLAVNATKIISSSYEVDGDLVDEATRAAIEGVPETHRPGLVVNRRIATGRRKTLKGREILASQAASRREQQTPEAQKKARKKAEELEKVQRINARPRTKKEIEMSNAIRNAGSLGS